MKYEIAIDCYRDEIVWLNGPYRGGEHDKNIYNMGLSNKVPEGKLVVCDRVYGSKKYAKDQQKLSLPSHCDSKELANFKALLHCRQESLMVG